MPRLPRPPWPDDRLVLRPKGDGPRHLCAWCDRDMGPAEDCGGDSHGMCDDCLEEMKQEFRDRPVAEATPAGRKAARKIGGGHDR